MFYWAGWSWWARHLHALFKSLPCFFPMVLKLRLSLRIYVYDPQYSVSNLLIKNCLLIWSVRIFLESLEMFLWALKYTLPWFWGLLAKILGGVNKVLGTSSHVISFDWFKESVYVTMDTVKERCPAFQKGKACPYNVPELKGLGKGCPEFKNGCPFKNVKTIGEFREKLGEMRDKCKGKANYDKAYEVIILLLLIIIIMILFNSFCCWN